MGKKPFPLLWVILAFSCAQVGYAKLRCYVSVAPQAYLVEELGKDQVEVHPIVQPGESEEAYQLSPQQRKYLSEADFYFYIGLPFELVLLNRLKTESKDKAHLTTIDCRKGITLLKFEGSCACCRGHDDKDPHIWLDPIIMAQMAKTMAEALSQKDPANALFYETNLKALEEKLRTLDQDLAQILAPVKGKTLLVFHPSYGYFVDRYGLKQLAIEKDGKEPMPKDLAKLVDFAKKENIHTLFVQPNFSTRTAETVANSLGARVIELDPLAPGNYPSSMESMATKITNSLQK